LLAEHDAGVHPDMEIDYVGGVPDSGTPHAIGYANRSGVPFARAFIKYTPTWTRSFMPGNQADRNKIAKMKQLPVHDLIKGKNLLFVDDSIVRGTQLRETVEFLYENGAKSVHIRSACPPIMFGCKFLNFTRSNNELELIARRVILELEGEEGFAHMDEYADASTERGKNLRRSICEKMHFDSLEFQSVENVLQAIGLDPCEVCTYCWTGKD
ncbi:MAG: amidophosphoribosyltransferase, partial [Oscillospiraceae bacterium]|nr:amidophosphoribosyltransferase [Oscillospiraceae bacterium]